jgi:hypothetical protein
MKKILYFLLFVVTILKTTAQNVTILPSGITPALSSTYPRISYDAILALPSPVAGDMAYDNTYNCLRVYNGTKWLCTYQNPEVPSASALAIATVSSSGFNFNYALDVAADATGNVYIIGLYPDTATFGTTSITSAGDADIFVAKYNSNGVLQWVQSAGGTGYDEANSIAVDVSGNVYITGLFANTATFGTTPKKSAGDFDIFIAKYSTTGVLQWVQSVGGIGSDSGNGIAVDGSGNVYVTGYYSGTATFGTTSKTSAGGSDIFMAKYNTAGELQWVQSAGGRGVESGNGIAVDGSGNVYVTGYYSGTTTFGTTSKTSAGFSDIFIAKYDPIGTSWSWVQSVGGTKFDFAKDLAVDDSGNAYVTGYFEGTATFGSESRTSSGFEDIFVVKYSTTGSFQWVQSVGGTSNDRGNGIAVDGSGNVYITGGYFGTINFGSISKTSAGSADIFIAKCSANGIFQWVQSSGGPVFDVGYGIATSSNNIFCTGSFSSTATFGSNTKTTNGLFNSFIMRLNE